MDGSTHIHAKKHMYCDEDKMIERYFDTKLEKIIFFMLLRQNLTRNITMITGKERQVRYN